MEDEQEKEYKEACDCRRNLKSILCKSSLEAIA